MGAEVMRAVWNYIEHIEAQGLQIESAYLFGSQVKGNSHEWSDVDLCVVSRQFSKNLDALSYLWRMRRRDDIRAGIEPVGFHPNQFNDESALASEILRYGIKIL